MTGPIEDLVVEERDILSRHELEVRADRLRSLEELAQHSGGMPLAEALARCPRIDNLRGVLRGEMTTLPDNEEGGL